MYCQKHESSKYSGNTNVKRTRHWETIGSRVDTCLVCLLSAPGQTSLFKIFLICIDALPACLSMHHFHVCYPQMPEKSTGSPTTGCEPLSGYFEPNLGTQREQLSHFSDPQMSLLRRHLPFHASLPLISHRTPRGDEAHLSHLLEETLTEQVQGGSASHAFWPSVRFILKPVKLC
jgi:hypothetical protein